MASFTLGFNFAWHWLLVICGGAAAVALSALIAAATIGILAALFDGVTNLIARRWKRRGYQPKGRLGKIILASTGKRSGEV